MTDDDDNDNQPASATPEDAPTLTPPAIEALAAELGRYRFHEIIGKGGMGAVYRAEQTGMERTVAIKVLLDPSLATSRAGARFQREARAMAQLNHPNIVKVFELGETSAGLPYFTMEFVEGGTLRDLIRRGPVDATRAMEITMQVCDALQYAHLHGVVHRDIKPGNILLDPTGRVKVADFGLAKITGHEESKIQQTRTRGGMGTLGYIAPEQMESGTEVDHRADIYSVGVTLYEMLTGDVPRGAFRPPSAAVAGLDARVDDIVLRAMLSEPDHRFQDVSDVRTSLEFIRQDPTGSMPLPDPRTTTLVTERAAPQQTPAPHSPPLPPSLAKKHSHTTAWLLALAALLILGAAGYFLFAPTSSPDAPTPPIASATTTTDPAPNPEPRTPNPEPAPAPSSAPAPNATPAPEPASAPTPLPPPAPTPAEPPSPGAPLPELVAAFEKLTPGVLLVWPRDPNANPDRSGTVAEIPPDLGDIVDLQIKRFWIPEDRRASTPTALALRADGTVAAWGNNDFGQCAVPTDLTDVVSISVAGKNSFALTRDGRVVTWGYAFFGKLNVPDNLEPVIAIAASGMRHSLALTRDGSIVAWGHASNADGAQDVPRDLENVIAIAAAAGRSLALTREGKVITWGTSGQWQPIIPDDLGNVTAIAAATRTELALREDGVLVGWGEKFPEEGLRIPGVKRLSTIRERESMTFLMDDDQWYHLDDEGGTYAPIPLPQAAGCTTVVVSDDFILGIRPVNQFIRRLTELDDQFRQSVAAERLPANDKALAELRSRYLTALERDRKMAAQAGALETAIALRDEIARMKQADDDPEAVPSDAPPELAKLLGYYLTEKNKLLTQREREATPQRQAFLRALQSLEREARAAGDNTATDAIRARIKELSRTP